MSQSESIDLLANALCKAQSAMTAAVLNKVNPHFKSKYADLAAVLEAVRKPLTDNGLSITQTTECNSQHFFLSTTLLHTSGQWLRSEYPLPMNATPQQMGSALTYARRYSLSAITGIAADEDDDGNAAQQKKNGKAAPSTGVISDEQAGELNALLLANPKISVEKFLELAAAPSISDIMAVKYDSAMQYLNKQIEKQKAKS
jgi:hypothetical protein